MKIYPRENLTGEFLITPDKSITHRALILGSIAKGKTVISNPLICDDTKRTIACLKKLGVKIKKTGLGIEVTGTPKFKGGAKLDCGNSGTTMRLLCGLIAGDNNKASLYGDKSLEKRPMRRIKLPLEEMGATVSLANYENPPILVLSNQIKQFDYAMTTDSAQVKSSILLCALRAGVECSITERNASRDHTEILIDYLGGNIHSNKATKQIVLKKSNLTGKEITICGDISTASYFIALGVLLGSVICKNVGINPKRMGFVTILKRMGANIAITNSRVVCGELVGDIEASKSQLKATHVDPSEIPSVIDELPLLAVIMGLSLGESIVSGASELKVKESNRVNSSVELINGLGGRARVIDGGFVINGVESYVGGNIKTDKDHRMAMSGAVGLICSKNGGDIDNAECVNISCPDFFNMLNNNKFALIGGNVTKSQSPKIHNFIMSNMAYSHNFSYTAKSITAQKLNSNVISEIKEYDGYNVTIPFKQEIIRHLSKTKDEAKLVKSVNCVIDGVGYSTDGNGFLLMLKYYKVKVKAVNVLVIGCGGAGKSIVCGLVKNGANVTVWNRTQSKSYELAKLFNHISVAKSLVSGSYDIIINATSVGMDEFNDKNLLSNSLIKQSVAVVDIIYHRKTALLKQAKEQGVMSINGLGMLFFQAYLSQIKFFNQAYREEEAFELFSMYLAKEQNYEQD